jgi:hypothetical protein
VPEYAAAFSVQPYLLPNAINTFIFTPPINIVYSINSVNYM